MNKNVTEDTAESEKGTVQVDSAAELIDSNMGSSNDEEPTPATDADVDEDKRAERSMKLPLSKIKTIMKTDPDVTLCSSDAAFLITRSTVCNLENCLPRLRFISHFVTDEFLKELFIKYLTEESYKSTKSSSRKTVQKRDVGRLPPLSCLFITNTDFDHEVGHPQ